MSVCSVSSLGPEIVLPDYLHIFRHKFFPRFPSYGQCTRFVHQKYHRHFLQTLLLLICLLTKVEIKIYVTQFFRKKLNWYRGLNSDSRRVYSQNTPDYNCTNQITGWLVIYDILVWLKSIVWPITTNFRRILCYTK